MLPILTKRIKISYIDRRLKRKEKENMDHIIDIEGLSYTYMKGTPYERLALKDVNLTVDSGNIVGIIGSTGSGKSTLVQHFNGLLKADSGKIIVDGIDLTQKKLDLKDLRRKIGLVFQYPEYQLFEETVEEDIAFAPRQFGFSEKEIKYSVASAMKSMHLTEEMRNRSPFSLSGGEMRRTAIAGILAMNPAVLVLDEPTAGLDPFSKKELLNIISELNREKKVTVIIVSHSMEEVVEIADKIVVMSDGKIISSGTPEEVFSDESVIKTARLLLPECTELMIELKEAGLPVKHNLCKVDDCIREIAKLFS